MVIDQVHYESVTKLGAKDWLHTTFLDLLGFLGGVVYGTYRTEVGHNSAQFLSHVVVEWFKSIVQILCPNMTYVMLCLDHIVKSLLVKHDLVFSFSRRLGSPTVLEMRILELTVDRRTPEIRLERLR